MVYSKRFLGRLVFQCCAFAMFWVFMPFFRQYLLLLAALITPRVPAEGRRAIIFTQTEVIYRPPFARPISASIAGVQNIKRSKVLISYGLKAYSVPGAVLTMANGETVALPLDFKERDEILRRLSAVTGKEIAEPAKGIMAGIFRAS